MSSAAVVTGAFRVNTFFREANKKSQELFPGVKVKEKHGAVPINFHLPSHMDERLVDLLPFKQCFSHIQPREEW